MIDIMTAPYGALLLRLCLGVMFLAHALLKWRVFTPPVEVEFFKSLGLPGWLLYVTITVELLGAAGLIFGIFPALRCVVARSGNDRNHRDRSRKKRLGIHQQRWRLGISGVLGSRPICAVSSRRWSVDADPVAQPVIRGSGVAITHANLCQRMGD